MLVLIPTPLPFEVYRRSSAAVDPNPIPLGIKCLSILDPNDPPPWGEGAKGQAMAESEPSNGEHMAEDQPIPAASATEEVAMDADNGGERRSTATVAGLLRGFLAVQQRRAEAYSTLRRYRRCSPVRPTGGSEL